MGVLHFSKSEFRELTPYEVRLAYEGWLEVQRDREDQEWRRTRQQCYMSYLTIPEKKRKMSIDRFWPIHDGEVENTTKAERMIRYKKKFGKLIN